VSHRECTQVAASRVILPGRQDLPKLQRIWGHSASTSEDNVVTPIPAGINQSRRQILVGTVVIAAVTAIVVRLMGQPLWCRCDGWSPWSWDIWSRHNSQHWIDPYTFTHVLHGILLCGLLYWLPRSVPERHRFLIAMVLEAIWEIQENSPMIIERYRTATIALEYSGDSVANVIGDIYACALGYWIAFYARAWRSVLLFLVTELILAIWIRDNLFLNVLMLIRPIDAIQQWQLGA
jgi:hypothetical protein